jgi:hypothetical protein
VTNNEERDHAIQALNDGMSRLINLVGLVSSAGAIGGDAFTMALAAAEMVTAVVTAVALR